MEGLNEEVYVSKFTQEQTDKNYAEQVKRVKKWLDESDGMIVFLALKGGTQVVRVSKGSHMGNLMWSLTKIFMQDAVQKGGE